MKNLTTIIVAMGALSTAGCGFMKEPYTQIQLAYAKSSSFPHAGKIDLPCARIREGAKTRGGEEVRLGADVCYGKLPPTTSERKYELALNEYIRKEVKVDGTTERFGLMVSLPMDYKLSIAKVNLPTSLPSKIGLRIPGTKDVDLSFWYTLGYSLNIIPTKIDYDTTLGRFDDVPGIGVYGNFYGEIAQELVLFGKFPLGTSIRADTEGKVTPLISGGYRVQW